MTALAFQIAAPLARRVAACGVCWALTRASPARPSARRRPRTRSCVVAVAVAGAGGDSGGGAAAERRAQDAREESLALLEWPALSARVAGYASTGLGRAALLGDNGMLEVPEKVEESERLLALTRDAYRLEYVLAKPLRFAGVEDIAGEVRMAAKGAALDGKVLVKVADTLRAARLVRRHVEAANAGGAEEEDMSEGEGGAGGGRSLNGMDARDRAMLRAMRAATESGSGSGGGQRLPALAALVTEVRSWPDVEAEIRETVDDFGDVFDSCDSQLAGLRRGIKDVNAAIREKLMAAMAANSDAIQDRVITTRFDRFVIPVKMSHKAKFSKGIVHDVSATGATAYIEPHAVRGLNDKLRELGSREKARCLTVLRKLSTEVVAQTVDDVDHLSSVLAIADAACARARASRSLNGVDVVFDDDAQVSLRAARHPLLSWQAMQAEAAEIRSAGKAAEGEEIGGGGGRPRVMSWKERVVPSDYVVNDGIRCVCVTGPNTGGKTISLKTLGISVLMAKAGMFVPAEGGGRTNADKSSDAAVAAKAAKALRSTAVTSRRWPQRAEFVDGHEDDDDDSGADDDIVRMPYFDNVLADIGDDQSLVQSLSTFSGHIERIKRILMRTTKKSLVLFDEIGSGTDPAEGAALGIALLRYLAGAEGERRAALTFATTHHGELKTLKYGTSVEASLFENASVEFDAERMAPTYRLLWGIPGRSNALAIARRLGLHSGVVSLAEELMSGGDMGEGRVNVSKMIADLESEKKAAKEARNETVVAWAEVDALRDELESRLVDLRNEEEDMRTESRHTLNKQLEEARKEIGDAIREMQKEGRSSKAAAEASSRIDGIKADTAEAFASAVADGVQNNHTPISVDTIKVGNRVSAPRLGGSSAEVVEVDKGRKEVTVMMGAMRARVKVRELTNVSRLQQSAKFNGQAAGSALAKKNAKKELKASRAGGGAKKTAVRTTANTIDIRGDRVEEAEAKVDVGISRSLVTGRMWVIHGHGTGRLRAGIRSYLAQHSIVEKSVLSYTIYSTGPGIFDCNACAPVSNVCVYMFVSLISVSLALHLYFMLCLATLRFEDATQNDGGTGACCPLIARALKMFVCTRRSSTMQF